MQLSRREADLIDVKSLIQNGASVDEIAAGIQQNHPKVENPVPLKRTSADIERSMREDPDGLGAWDTPDDINALQQAVLRGDLTTEQYGQVIALLAEPTGPDED